MKSGRLAAGLENAGLGVVAALAILVHGYHLGSDDAEIYIPAIKRVADPALFPFGSEFFMQHARLSFFSNVIGDSARLTRLPADWAIFIWHGISILLLLVAARRLLRVCFTSKRAEWAGIALLAAVLTVPVAGTALVIMDPYVTARSLSTPMTLFAVAGFAAGNLGEGWLWLLATGVIHPQMAVYGVAFFACLQLVRYFEQTFKKLTVAPAMAAMAVLPLSFDFKPAVGVYRDVLLSRSYFFVSHWRWWEWIGALVPLWLLWWFGRAKPGGTLPAFTALCRALVFLGAIFTGAGIVLASSEHLDSFMRLQPMRSLHLIYVVFFLFTGALLGEHILKARVWRWCCLFVPLAAGMWTVQAQAYPSSAHVEWPGATYDSGWPSSFIWIREHTPKGVIFALDPNYMAVAEDDQHGFRAIAERSVLADNLKDSGAVSLFPELASDWKRQVNVQKGWDHFRLADFHRLADRFGVNWIVLKRGQVVTGLQCPYQNKEVRVCRL